MRQAPEPATFDRDVRRPGQAFLKQNPTPRWQDHRRKNYWTRALPDLSSAYGRTCAYCACWIPTHESVDHFLPKSAYPKLAYEWSNFRLALEKLNHRKGDSVDIADPFTIQDHWFVLDFASMFVEPGMGLSRAERELVERTIEVLKLNDDDALVNWRFRAIEDYVTGEVSLQHLERNFPFIARELCRQGLEERLKRPRSQ